MWGASVWGWAPDVTRQQRHGDLLALSDMLNERPQRRKGGTT